MALASGDWLPYVPVPGLSQVWNVLNSNQVLQTDGCVSYSTIDSVITQVRQQLGIQIEFSRRFMAWVSKTTTVGNSVVNVFNAFLKYGPVLETSWPQNDSMTWDEFYADPTPEQLAALYAEGQQWLKVLNPQLPQYDIPPSELTSYLQKAPVIAFIPSVNPDHAVEVVNLTTMFNSEPASSNPLTEYIQPFSVSQGNSFHQIIIEASMNTFVETMDYNGTIGIFVPVSSPSQLPLLNSIFNINLVAAPDGSIATSKTVVDKAA
jgi:hypothetical protein